MNAINPLKIPTPEGSDQALHPDVLYINEGFMGYKYWMACTPYPYGMDVYENPIVRVSHDGISWCPFDGAPDPIIFPRNKDWHNADTDLLYTNECLYIFFMTTNRGSGRVEFLFMKTADGIEWTNPVCIYEGLWAVSPTVVSTNSGYYMWHVERDPSITPNFSKIYRRESINLINWSEKIECLISIPGYVVWHIDIVKTSTKYEALVTAYAELLDPSVSRLYYFDSDDGLVFKEKLGRPFLKPSLLGWDNRMIYRSTFVNHDEDVVVWYSAASWSFVTGIGRIAFKKDEGPRQLMRCGHHISFTIKGFSNFLRFWYRAAKKIILLEIK